MSTNYRLFTPQTQAAEGVALFGPRSKRRCHLGTPYSVVSTVFDIPQPPDLLPPVASSFQNKLLQGSESHIIKSLETTNFLDKSIKRSSPSAANPSKESVEVKRQRLQQNRENKRIAKDTLCF